MIIERVTYEEAFYLKCFKLDITSLTILTGTRQACMELTRNFFSESEMNRGRY